MTKTNELKNKVDAIDNLVREKIISENENLYPITDGVIDVEKYTNAKYKILWILKEPYDDFDENGEPEEGGWDLKEVISGKQTISSFGKARKTFKNITYATWGILNDFCAWGDMPDLDENPEMLESLKSIGYINVKKLPGKTSSYDGTIKAAYDSDKEVLLKQIQDYNPDIIIGGYTLHHFFADLGISANDMIKNNSVDYTIKGNSLFIHAYHPAQREGSTGVSEEEYCNDIVQTVKIWALK